jgi:hypothetical protein
MATPLTPTAPRPADVCRARAVEARGFALASCGGDVAVWLEVAHAWDLAADAHIMLDERPRETIGDLAAVAETARLRAHRLTFHAQRQAA